MHSSDGKRSLLLIALLGLGLALPIWGQEGDEELRQEREARERLIESIPVPEDRDAVAGRFAIGGRQREVTRGEIYDLLVLITRLDGAVQNMPNEDDTWTRLMLVDLADSLGIHVPASELDNRLHRKNPEIFNGIVERWATSGVGQEQGLAYEADRMRIDRLKDFLLTNERQTTHDAFDQFKINRLLYQIDYAGFSGKKHSDALRAEGISDEDLENYWKGNPGIQARFRLPARISGTVVYLDPREYGEEEANTLSQGGTVSRERALAYFQANRERLIASIPPAERQFLTITPGTPIDQIKSPFELVRGTIEKKLALEHLIDDAFKEAIQGGFNSDLPAIAAKHHLHTIEFTDLDRRAAMDSLQKIGVAAFTQLFASNGPRMCGAVLVFEDVRYFFRIDDKKESTIPEFATVKDELRELYYELMGAEAAQEEARSIYGDLAARVATQVAPQREQLEKEANEAADKRIAELGLTNPAEQNRERARSLSRVRLEMDRLEREARPAVFEKLVQERGLELRRSPLFQFDTNREDRSRIEDPEVSRMAFFRTCYQLRAMKPGEVAPAPLEDHLTHEFYLARLVEVRDPELETMGPVDLIQARGQLQQITEARFPREYEYNALAARFGLERF